MSQEPELNPRKVLFGNPERTSVRLSHDGARISYLAPVDGVMNVWIAPVRGVEEARPVTEDKGSGMSIHFWTYNPSYVIYLQDREGDENWHVYAVNVETGESRDLTLYDGVQAIPKECSPKFPDEALIPIINMGLPGSSYVSDHSAYPAVIVLSP